MGAIMFKYFMGTGLAILLSTGAAYAANCPTNPYNLTNGTSADAAQVMANFNNLLNCGNNNLAPLASPQFTGNVGIGTSSPAAPLDIFNSSDSADQLHVRVGTQYLTIGSYGSTGYSTINSYNSSLGARVLVLQSTGAKVGVGTATPAYVFAVNGTAGGTSGWQVISDARLKTNIQPVTNAVSLIGRLNPVRYDWRNPGERSIGKDFNLPVGERQIGFLAQEVEKVVPEAVAKPGKGGDATYSLKQENLIPLLVAAIKEQQAEIEQLRVGLAALTPAATR